MTDIFAVRAISDFEDFLGAASALLATDLARMVIVLAITFSGFPSSERLSVT